MSVNFRTATNYIFENSPLGHGKLKNSIKSIKPFISRNVLPTNQLILILFILGTFMSKAFAEDKLIKTIAGNLSYFKNNKTSECTVLLNKNIILKLNCEDAYLPEVVGNFREKVGMLDEVVILQEMPMGNACNGGPLHLIGLKKNKSHQITGPLDFCGGKAPIIKRQEETISITFPGGPPNRGTGHIPTEKWIYRNGQLKKIK